MFAAFFCMNRLELIGSLKNYSSSFPEEKVFTPRFISLLRNFPNCYHRSLLSGHMTASSWIVNEAGTSVLLVHHKKLNRWLQPGGHADGDEYIVDVARKEASEETGLKSLKLYDGNIFDIDIHLIPSYKEVKSHFHHDIRFLFTADMDEDLVVSCESNELAWIPLGRLAEYVGNNKSIHRMGIKTNSIFK